MKRVSLIFVIICVALLFSIHLSSDAAESDLYAVGPNDVLDIKVLDHDDLRTMTTVTSDGTVTFPYIGTVSVKGMSLADIEKTITERLSEGYIKFPVVSVTLVKSLSKKIFSYGEVIRRGDIPLEENMTVLKALSMAGGATENGIYGQLQVKRKTKAGSGSYKNVAESELNNGVIEDKKVENMVLQNEDILIVERNKTFLVQGETAQRGRFVLEKGVTVLRAVLLTGGLSSDGLYGRIKLRRKQESEAGGYKDIAESKLNDGVIEDKKVENIFLQPDDILIVERNKTFLVQGETGQRGRFVLEKDMTVIKALLQAGGVSSDGLYGRIKLRRKEKSEAGGYKDIAESKLSDGAIEDKKVENMLLQPDDILIVERNETYFVYGEVLRPGEFVLQDDMTVLKAITIAGGFTKWGSDSRVKILRQREDDTGFETIKVRIDDVIDGDLNADILLKPGDTVVASKGVF